MAKIESAPPAWLAFLRGHAALTRDLDRHLRGVHDLTLNEYEVLLALWLSEKSRLRRVDLAERLLITQGGVTRLLAGLEKRGLVRRASSATDGRVVYAELTAAGKRLAGNARRDHLGEVDRLFTGRFSARELATLREQMDRLHPAA